MIEIKNNKTWSKKLILSDSIVNKRSGIYKILNLITGVFYIGSAKNFRSRNGYHYHQLVLGKHHSKYLQRAFNKYKEENFKFIILEYCEKVDLIIREQFYLDTLLFAQEWIRRENKKFRKLGYNIQPTAGSNIGYKFSKKDKNKMSKSRLFAIKTKNIQPWNKGLSGQLPPRLQETKDKISKTLSGIKRGACTQEHKNKLSKAAFKRGPHPRECYKNAIIKKRQNSNYDNNIKKMVMAASIAKMKKVYQIESKSNQIVKIFNSIKEAGEFLGPNTAQCIRRAYKANRIYKGFLWKIMEL